MKSTVIDADGNVTCPNCGAKNNFTSKRSGKAKGWGIATIGVFAVAMPKRLQCQGCGTYLKTGGMAARSTTSTRAASAAGARTARTDGFAVELRVPGQKKITVIKEVRAVTSLGLADAKGLVDGAAHRPTVLAYLPEDQAHALVARLSQAGATAVVIPPKRIDAAPEATPERVTTIDIPEQIRKLGELHTAGILTADEFQTKKSELLDRM
jgi:large subunit ribosomal protein L7/L12